LFEAVIAGGQIGQRGPDGLVGVKAAIDHRADGDPRSEGALTPPMPETAAEGFDLRIGQILLEGGHLNGRGKNLAAELRSCRYHARRASLFHETGFATHLIDKAGPLLLHTRACDRPNRMPLGTLPGFSRAAGRERFRLMGNRENLGSVPRFPERSREMEAKPSEALAEYKRLSGVMKHDKRSQPARCED
jgi:hypothetical protein